MPLSPAAPSLTLNTFQWLMHQWTSLGPYNAGQFMQVSGCEDAQRWQNAATGLLQKLGLGHPTFQERQVSFTPVTQASFTRSGDSLEILVNRELNRPFAAGEVPIRFFMIPAEGNSHYVGAIYDHWIADSRAMRSFMQQLFGAYQDPTAEPAERLTLEAPSFQRCFGHGLGLWPRLTGLRLSLWNMAKHRSVYRVNLQDPLDFHCAFFLHPLPEGLLGKLRSRAKELQVSMHDLFLAALGQSMGEITRQGREKKRRFFFPGRTRLALGTIVDIREQSKEALDSVFGMYLSCYTLLLSWPESKPMAELAREVARKTGRIKRSGVTLKSHSALEQVDRWWKIYQQPKHRALLFHKNIPTDAGISNVNLGGSWIEKARATPNSPPGTPQILDYRRISPAGPLLPFVLTLTSLHGRLSLCVTYRRTAFSPEEARELTEQFITRLSSLE